MNYSDEMLWKNDGSMMDLPVYALALIAFWLAVVAAAGWYSYPLSPESSGWAVVLGFGCLAWGFASVEFAGFALYKWSTIRFRRAIAKISTLDLRSED